MAWLLNPRLHGIGLSVDGVGSQVEAPGLGRGLSIVG